MVVVVAGAWVVVLSASSTSRSDEAKGQAEQGSRLLGELYEKFSEGFETADLLEARSLLDELRAG